MSFAEQMKPVFEKRFPEAAIQSVDSQLQVFFDHNNSRMVINVSRDPTQVGNPITLTPYFSLYEKSIRNMRDLGHWDLPISINVQDSVNMDRLLEKMDILSQMPAEYVPCQYIECPTTHFEVGAKGQITVWAGNTIRSARVLGIWNLDLETGTATDDVHVPGANPFFLVSYDTGKNKRDGEVLFRDKHGWLPVIKSTIKKVHAGHPIGDVMMNLQDEQVLKKASELFVRKTFGKQKEVELAS